MSNLPTGLRIDLDGATGTAEKLHAAAVFLFAQRGYAGTSIRDIATLTGVTNAAVYHFVKNKEDLLLDIMREGLSLVHTHTETMLETATTPEDRLAALIIALAGAHGKNRRISFVTDGEMRALTRGTEGFDDIVALRDGYESLWDRVIAEGVAEGVFEVQNARITKLALLNMCTGLSDWYRPDGPNTLEEIIEEFVELGFRLVRATRDGVAVTRAGTRAIDLGSMRRAAWEPVVVATDSGRAA